MNDELTSTNESRDTLSNDFNVPVKKLEKRSAELKNMMVRADTPLAVLHNHKSHKVQYGALRHPI